jgi:N-acetyl-beta-hexosaminidase
MNGDVVPLLPLVPQPVSVEPTGAAPLSLTAATIAGPADAASALAEIVAARTGLALSTSDGEAGDIVFRLEPGGAPESYRIVVDEATARVIAPDAAGLFYAAHTLGQLLARDGDAWTIPAGTIDDAPRFAYRGVMLDVARHFHPVETVKAYIDRAAALKLNVLHLHLTDDQGWRLQLASRPKLTELASGTAVGGDPGGFYTKADYAEIVAYALSRHMTVVPEFDMPGHTHAVGLAYPELAEEPVLSAHIEEIADSHGGGLPQPGVPYEGMAVGFSSLKTREEATYEFVADVFGELAGMTPGPYLHFGGDESLATNAEDFSVFTDRVSEIIADLGKTPIAWHEAGSRTIDDSTVGQYWGFVTPTAGMDDKARAFVANGARLILSPSDAVYLDMKYDASTPLGLTWANGPTSVERAYSWEPASVIDGIDESDILGVEAPLWAETVRTPGDIDMLAFPRIAAAAEAAWSAASAHDWASFRVRVGGLAPLWEAQGIAFHRSPEIDWVAG